LLQSLVRLLHALVIGKDCPQRAEVFLRLSPSGLGTLLAIAISRLRTVLALWRSTRSYEFRMSPDVAANVAFISDFVQGPTRTLDEEVRQRILPEDTERMHGSSLRK